MLIKSPDELPRKTLFKRFPIPHNAQVPPEFRIQPGKVASVSVTGRQIPSARR
ncbi:MULTISPECIES: hypothetical protein [unclassified Marinobacter]|uniref:hypothetical protein n=1 Tax=unclassified Marinobacter TaxID=83889 RepID=UPI000C01C857|nr:MULTISPECIES: hypothetical protein [unclassified Marinobacter]PFG08561.1 hypothetical protein ATI45_0846 [Marinobacter sp. LV10MA510-1]PFG54408.1 hypothetical protein ATG98_3649 [Marinobacter sp. LV10R520-4]